jgi:FkbM family methyltransferase
LDAITTGAALTGQASGRWPDHDPRRMARDFLLWRHLRVLRARTMRHVRRLAAGLQGQAHPPAQQTAYGVRMIPNWNDRTYAYCHYGTYGPYLADLILAVDQPFLFLDIGANQGLFSLIAARNPLCEAIVALEPVPETHTRLLRNLAMNGLGRRAQALPFGLSDRAGTYPIACRRGHSGVATLEGHLARREPDAISLAVEMRTVAGLVPYLPSDLPIFVKIDVEGHEAQVITQLLSSQLSARIMAIFYEHDDHWSDSAAIATLLGQSGFAINRQYGRGRHYDVLALPLDPLRASAAPMMAQ